VEHKLRLTRLGHILLTRCDARTSNGLPGLFLTLSDVALGAGAPPVQVRMVGPPRTDGLLRAISTVVGQARHCRITAHVISPSLDAKTADTAQVVYSDAVVTIYGIPIAPLSSSLPRTAVPDGDGDGASPDAKRQRTSISAGEPEMQPSMCYLCVLADVPGKFDNAAAEALGVPRGAVRGQLCRGEAVTLDSGVVITPEQVCSPPVPGPALLMLDCPTQGHVDGAMAALGRCATLAGVRDRIGVVFHLSPRAVIQTPQYSAMLAYVGGERTTHVMAAPAVPSTGGAPGATIYRSSSLVATRLSMVHRDVFPPLVLDGDAPQTGDLAAGSRHASDKFIAGGNLMRWRLRPLASAGLDTTSVPPPLSATDVRTALAAEWSTSVAGTLKAVQHAWDTNLRTPPEPVPPAVAALAADRSAAPELVFLGTGAAIPSKYRNVSGILLRMAAGPPDAPCMILDCGEGSLGQMQRRLGASGAVAALRALKCVWISHIHADHHLGVLSILAARRALLGGAGAPPLCVVGPMPLRRVLESHAVGVEPLNYTFVDLADTAKHTAAVHPAYAAAMQQLGLTQLVAVPVIHCPHAYAAVLHTTGGLKVVYSGDTRPCDALISAARDASLLIHEATFEDALLDEAVAKKHSLTREAVASGASAGAYRTLLTHFSQRYPKIPVIDDTFATHTGIAFDMMRLNLADLPALPSLVPALRAVFPANAAGDAGDDEPVLSAEDLQ
jgi:ribonuclease Z